MLFDRFLRYASVLASCFLTFSFPLSASFGVGNDGSSPIVSENGGALLHDARFNALEFGVVADETIDSTDMLQRALDAAGAAGGGVVELPSGRFRFDGCLRLPAGVTLLGTYRLPPTAVNKDEKPTGTTLLTYANRGKPEGEPFITLDGSNSAVIGVVVIYPEWKQSDVPPTPYPPCIASRNTENVGVLDCCLLNPYEGIHFELAHRHLVRNVTGYPIWRGLFVDQCYDIGHIENIHFWPFGLSYKPDDPYCKWININGVAFEFARSDWHYVSNTFCFGYGCGYYFSDRGHGGTNGNFLGIGADSCRRAVLVEQSQKQGLLITNGEFVGRWTSEDSVCLEIGEKNDGAVMLTNCSFWGPVKTCVSTRQKTGRLSLNSCEFVNWDEVHSSRTKEGAPAIEVLGGRATLNCCSFEQGGIHLKIGSDAVHVTAIGNQAPGGFRIEGDKSPMKLQSLANEQDPLEVYPEGLDSYQVRFGEGGDSRFIRHWNGPEEGENSTFRWSSDESLVLLPVADERPIDVEMVFEAPHAAFANDSESDNNRPDLPAEKTGVYYRDKLLAEFKPGLNETSFVVVPTLDDAKRGEVSLRVCCNGWRPCDVLEGSNDERTLGVQLFSARVKKRDVKSEKIFDANLGVWSD